MNHPFWGTPIFGNTQPLEHCSPLSRSTLALVSSMSKTTLTGAGLIHRTSPWLVTSRHPKLGIHGVEGIYIDSHEWLIFLIVGKANILLGGWTTHLKNINQLGSLPQVIRGENKKYLSCRHLVYIYISVPWIFHFSWCIKKLASKSKR